MITWSSLAALLVIGIGAFWWASWDLNGDVAQELRLWRLAKASYPAGVAPLIDGTLMPDEWEYAGDRPLTSEVDSKSAGDNSRSMRRVVFHRDLEEKTQRPLRVPFVFKIDRDINELRRKAQNAVFVTDVLQPLLKATRVHLGNNKWQEQHAGILSRLLQIETASQTGGTPVPSGELFMGPLLKFGVRPIDPNNAQNLYALFDRTYLPLAGGKRPDWPPGLLSAGGNLADNKPIRSGLENLRLFWQQRASDVNEQTKALAELRNALDDMRKFEGRLDSSRPLDRWTEEVGRYIGLRDKVDRALKDCITLGVLSASDPKMNDAAEMILTVGRTGKEKLKEAILGARNADALDRFQLVREVNTELDQLSDGEGNPVRATFSESKRRELQDLDQRLQVDDTGEKIYIARVRLFEVLLALRQSGSGTARSQLIGKLAEYDEMIRRKTGEERPKVPSPGVAAPPMVSSDPVPRAARELLLDLYEGEFNQFLEECDRFPLVSDRTDRLIEVKDLLRIRGLQQKIRDDLASLGAMAAGGRPVILKGRIERRLYFLDLIMPALVNAKGDLARITVSYPGKEEQAQTIEKINDALYVGFRWRYLKFNNIPAVHVDVPKEVKIDDFPVVSDDLLIRFVESQDGKLSDDKLAALDKWMLFRQMLAESLPVPWRSADGLTWRVVFPGPKIGQKMAYFTLAIRFAQKLPDRVDWPTSKDLKNPGR